MIFTILTLIGVRIKSFNKYGGALKIVLSKCIIIAKKMFFFFSLSPRQQYTGNLCKHKKFSICIKPSGLNKEKLDENTSENVTASRTSFKI